MADQSARSAEPLTPRINERGEIEFDLPREAMREFWEDTGWHIVLNTDQAKQLGRGLINTTGNLKCSWCTERYDHDLSVWSGTQLPDQFCTPECEKEYRKKKGPFAPRSELIAKA